MKTKVLALILIPLLAGCSQGTTGVISRERAVSIAAEAHPMDYHRGGEIEVERTNGQYIVTFPIDKRIQPGTRYRGPDYAARVWLDARTGKVLETRLGS